MDILYLLVPLSVVMVLLILIVLAWALNSGQFEDLEREGLRILGAAVQPSAVDHHWPVLDADQASRAISNK